ncbi:MAG TPA: HEAT repeat domain-containing protein [Vicinamibacterales bacterium]|nr:HEAT repeat domain-containing protein [Vicinamibacterales bacterium]
MRIFIAVLLVVFTAVTGDAQVRDRTAPASPPSDASTLAAGWSALAAGQHAAAARAAAQVLARSPWNHAAAALRIEALAQADPIKGLDAYEAWLGKRRSEDAALLEPVPRNVLLQFAVSGESDLRQSARRMLRDAGITPPASPNRDVSDQLADAAARAKAGDPAAVKRLEAVVDAGTLDPAVVARALEAGGPATTPLLLAMLDKPGTPTRAAAAAALGRRKADEARPALQKLMKDSDPMVRSSAAVALARMGDDEGQAYVERMLQSEVPDFKLMAAEAWGGQPGPWMGAIAPLLENRDGTIRLEAARLLAPVSPEAARRVLNEAAADSNPVIRSEAARIIEETTSLVPDLADISQARRLLREADPAIRLHAAGVLLAAARAGA